MRIAFYYQGIQGKFNYSGITRELIRHIIAQEKKQLGEVGIIFTDNRGILSMNKSFLKHSYYTDVITFDYNWKDRLSGDIFVSVEQVTLNARIYKNSVEEELFRVIIHGILHLIGYVDDNEDNRRIMCWKEEQYLKWLKVHKVVGSDEFSI